jgi:hypothetical protein
VRFLVVLICVFQLNVGMSTQQRQNDVIRDTVTATFEMYTRITTHPILTTPSRSTTITPNVETLKSNTYQQRKSLEMPAYVSRTALIRTSVALGQLFKPTARFAHTQRRTLPEFSLEGKIAVGKSSTSILDIIVILT